MKRKMLFVGRKDDVVHFNPNLFIVCQLLVLNGPLMPILTMRIEETSQSVGHSAVDSWRSHKRKRRKRKVFFPLIRVCG